MPSPPKDVLSKLLGQICELVDRVVDRHRRKPPQSARLKACEDVEEYAASEK
jgi:hypothetical protein